VILKLLPEVVSLEPLGVVLGELLGLGVTLVAGDPILHRLVIYRNEEWGQGVGI